MGWKLLMVSGLSPGVTAVSLSVWGAEPKLKEQLKASVMNEEIAGRQSLTRLDGMGSRTQVEFLVPTIKLDSSGMHGRTKIGVEWKWGQGVVG